MSTASRSHERKLEQLYNRTKPKSYRATKPEETRYIPPRFDVTEFQDLANRANHINSRADLANKNGRLGAHGNGRRDPAKREQLKLQKLAKQADQMAKQLVGKNTIT